MDDVKIHTVQPVGERRPTERPQVKQPASGRKWEQTLQEAYAQMDGVSRNLSGSAPANAPADPKALRDEVRRANEQFQQMMKLHQNLSRLYWQIRDTDSNQAESP
jgi:hypothetical protein